MKLTLRPKVTRAPDVDQIAQDLFNSEGAPMVDPLPECVEAPAGMPVLDPRRMPALLLACPEPQGGAAQRYRMPLWRNFELPQSG
jgi:hypothetical protein